MSEASAYLIGIVSGYVLAVSLMKLLGHCWGNPKRNSIKCIFCDREFSEIESLRHHSSQCSSHPAVRELEIIASDLECLADSIRMQVNKSN